MRDGMVIIKKYPSETQARVDSSRLEAMGIASWVETDNCDGMYPQLDLMFGVKLLVLQEEAAPAGELLGSQAQAVVDHPWNCPGCETHIDAGYDACWNCGAAYSQ